MFKTVSVGRLDAWIAELRRVNGAGQNPYGTIGKYGYPILARVIRCDVTPVRIVRHSEEGPETAFGSVTPGSAAMVGLSSTTFPLYSGRIRIANRS